ncbi:MAG: DUF190 domain-containing protein [Desulfovibrio sp.]
MEGYLVTFFTQQNRTHNDVPLADWIVDQAKQLGVGGATMFTGKEGFGHDGRYHSPGYFDLEDQPLQVAMAVSLDELNALFVRFQAEGVRVFYTKARIEFGFTCET